MRQESVRPVNEKSILREFTCPSCGGHTLKAKIECDASITGFDDLTAYFRLDEAQDQEYAIALFFCNDCQWNCDEESEARDYMR
jgi:hypothetical protein